MSYMYFSRKNGMYTSILYVIIFTLIFNRGSGEIRTHGGFDASTVFKTVAINQTLPHFLIFYADERT